MITLDLLVQIFIDHDQLTHTYMKTDVIYNVYILVLNKDTCTCTVVTTSFLFCWPIIQRKWEGFAVNVKLPYTCRWKAWQKITWPFGDLLSQLTSHQLCCLHVKFSYPNDKELIMQYLRPKTNIKQIIYYTEVFILFVEWSQLLKELFTRSSYLPLEDDFNDLNTHLMSM